MKPNKSLCQCTNDKFLACIFMLLEIHKKVRREFNFDHSLIEINMHFWFIDRGALIGNYVILRHNKLAKIESNFNGARRNILKKSLKLGYQAIKKAKLVVPLHEHEMNLG